MNLNTLKQKLSNLRLSLLGLLSLSLFVLVSLTACESTRYLWQAAEGQWEILSNREPLQEVIEHPETPPKTASQLKFIEHTREYARQHLDLPVGHAYSTFVDLQRPYVVWNLFVAPEFSLANQTWCYPIAGCVAYKGYFDKEDAYAAEKEWQQKQYDTYVGGVSAYSTLGWFDDPVLNTFLYYDKVSLAALLFHELAHRKLYVKNDTMFNESWATAVEQESVDRYLAYIQKQENHQSAPTAQQVQRYQSRFKERSIFVSLVKETLSDLRNLYKTEDSLKIKRDKKEELINKLRANYAKAVADKLISNRYSRWFNSEINNAKLSTVASYHSWVPGLRYKIRELNRNLPEFYSWSVSIAALPKTERDELLRRLNKLAAASGNSQ